MGSKRLPEVRFEGFCGEWDFCCLSDISEKMIEKNKEILYTETLTNSAEFGIISQKDFFDKEISNIKNLDGYYIVHPDYFVYNPRISNFAPVGPIKRNNLGRTGVMSPLYYVFKVHDIDKTYLETYFSTNKWHDFMKMNGDSGARSDRFAIKDSVLNMMPIPLPTAKEQTLIGNFFKHIDDTIALKQQELKNLKKTKQGFLQKMFPKDGESVPEIRFDGFSGDWEERKLGEVGSISMCKRIYKEQTNIKGDIPFYKIGTFGGIADSFITEKLFTEYKNKFSFPKIGDVLISASGTIGRTVVYNGEKAYYQDSNIVWLNCDTNSLINTFLKQFYEIIKWEGIEGSTIKRLYNSNILSTSIFLPTTQEQTLIGNFFKQLDDTINLHQRELEAMKQTKKAFLQKMFV